MNINFNDSTFEKLRFLADREERSVAAFVSMRMDELTGQLVNTTFSLNDLPAGTQLAHMDPTPRPAPIRSEQYSLNVAVQLPGDNNENIQRRRAEEEY